MAGCVCDPRLLHHFSVFAYPFHHDLTARNRAARLRSLASRWEPWWARMSEHELAIALDAPSFFLPHTRALLFPESIHLDTEPAGDQYRHWAQLLRHGLRGGLEAFYRDLPAEAVLRLTYRADQRWRFESFAVVPAAATGSGMESTELQATLDWVDALLFPDGIGLLLLKVRLAEAQPHLAQLIRLNQDLRLVHPPSVSWSLARLRFQANTALTPVRDLIDALVSGLAVPPAVAADKPAFLGFRRPEKSQAASETVRGIGERCQVFSYACIQLSDAQRQAAPVGDFPSAEERILFEFGCGIALERSVRDATWAPMPEQIERLARNHRLAPWRCWRALVLRESCVFLGTEDVPFNHSTLPRNLESCYLPLSLFVLLQQYQLFAFAHDLQRQVAHGTRKLRAARALQDRFIAFRSRYWFSEVTRKPQGSDLYRLLQQGLEVPALFQMLTDSIKDVREHHERERARSLEWCMKIVAWGASPPLAWWTYVTNPQHRWLTLSVAFLAALVAATQLPRLWRWGKRPPWASRNGTFRTSSPGTPGQNDHARAA